MKINLLGILVDDQVKAREFYSKTLGFQIKHNTPMGEHHWITLVSPDDPNGPELSLEPDIHPAAKPFKQAMVNDGIPFTSFAVQDINAEHKRLESLGVRFTTSPTDYGTVIAATFDDTCGNLIQITQEKEPS